MTNKIGFDNELYLKEQSKCIRERVDKFGGKLYLEFGGKLFDDFHASRVLPGFDVNGKVKLLSELKDQAEIIFCISAGAIEKNKIRADIGITYDMDVLRLIDNLRNMGLYIGSILITQYKDQPSAEKFRKKLEMRGERVYIHRHTKGYPSDVDTIVSDEGYGANPYIETSRPIVVVTAPGPGSGKLATCLSQLYHEYKRGIKAGYAKYETFPVWNLPLNHPVNVAYEAATADLKDVNMIDPFHLSAYNQTTVNYNRDIDAFPVVRTILHRIMGEDLYKSPTDMGVNMIGNCIVDDAVCQQAAKDEIIRRWYKARVAFKRGEGDKDSIARIEMLMSTQGINCADRPCVSPALEKAKKTDRSCVALELHDGTIITGKSSELMNDTAACILNAIKHLAKMPDSMLLISPAVLEPIIDMKKHILGSHHPVLQLEEVLQALSLSAVFNPTVTSAMGLLPELRNCELHSSDIMAANDENTLLKMGINFTCEPEYPTKSLYFH